MPIRGGRSNAVRVSNGVTTAVRSGRFQFEISKGGKEEFAIGVAGSVYRVFNTENTEFKIQTDNFTTIPLRAGASMDITISGTGKIWVPNPEDDEIETLKVSGVYDKLGNPWNPIRSGRFSGDASTPIEIISDESDGYYRVLNSGKRSPFKVKWKNKQIPVMPRCSVDVAVEDSVTIELVLAQLKKVDGIYDCLDTRNPSRSGRFWFRKIENPNGNDLLLDPKDPQRIIDSRSGSETAQYRIFNAGENPIIVERYQGITSESVATVIEDRSFDFGVPTGRTITVRSETTDAPIKGMYELLGRG